MAPEQNYRSETLGGLEKHQIGVLVTCLACNRHISVPAAGLIAVLGPGFPVPEVAKRTRCQKCGGRGDESRPDWRVECRPDLSHLLPKPGR